MNDLKKFLSVQAIVSALINFTINAVLAVFLFRGISSVPLWGNPGIAADTLATAFLLPFLTVIIVAPFAINEMKKGTIGRFNIELLNIKKSFLKYMPDNTFIRSIVFGVIFTLILTPLMLGGLYIFGITELSFNYFFLYKTSFAAIISFPVSPLVWLTAMMHYA